MLIPLLFVQAHLSSCAVYPSRSVAAAVAVRATSTAAGHLCSGQQVPAQCCVRCHHYIDLQCSYPCQGSWCSGMAQAAWASCHRATSPTNHKGTLPPGKAA